MTQTPVTRPSASQQPDPQPPTVVVLAAAPEDRPPHLEPIADRVELRVVGADGLAAALPGARALFLWDFFSTAVAGAWPAADALEWIHVAAAGVDSLLFDELRASEVTVTNARGVFDRAIAEYVLTGVLAHAKQVHELRALQREHVWQHRETQQVAGKHALVVGTGAIGRQIARLLAAVGLQVRGAGRRPGTDPDFGEIVSSAELPAHVGWADYVIGAVPLTPSTTGLFDAAVFAAMRPGAHFINIGRGPSVVEDDLLDAVRDGPLDGATLDVFAQEPLPAGSPLWDAPGVVITSHLSGDVVGWRDALARQFADNAERWLDGQPLRNVVDKRLGYVPGASR